MDFTYEPNLTKDLILSKYSEEQIMGFYLKIPIKKGLFRSPLRKDKRPTCSLFRNKNKLIYKDFATGDYLDIFAVVQKIFNCNFYEALEIIANDFGIKHSDSYKKNKGIIQTNYEKIEDKEIAKIQVEIQDFTDKEIKWWNQYGITPEILKKFDVYSCKHIFLNDNLFAKSQFSCPIYGYYGGKYHGFELWRCYFPLRTEYRFITNWPTKKIQGFKQLPKKGKLLVITKSMKDTMCLYSMGISSCSPNSETQFLSDSVLEELKERFEHIIVFFDNDQTGISFMNSIKRKHPELIYTWIPRKYRAKDISDFYKKYQREETIKLIKNFILYLKNE